MTSILKNRWLVGVVMFMLCSQSVFAQSLVPLDHEMRLDHDTLRLSSERILEGSAVRIYATVRNLSNFDLRGTVMFYDHTAGHQIGTDQTVSILANSSDDIFIDWIPYSEGKHSINLTLEPWIIKGDDDRDNSANITIDVLKDTDHDGITDEEDPDDDNDGVNDEEDHFPFDSSEQTDTDGDRIGDNKDDDDDNDSHLDENDAFPLNSMEWEDSDEDGIGNNEDEDDDNDGLSDDDEKRAGTDPLLNDSDEDGVLDGDDAFPTDPFEQYDYDNDGLGDNIDADDDDDGLLDDADPDDFRFQTRHQHYKSNDVSPEYYKFISIIYGLHKKSKNTTAPEGLDRIIKYLEEYSPLVKSSGKT